MLWAASIRMTLFWVYIFGLFRENKSNLQLYLYLLLAEVDGFYAEEFGGLA
jgi:hypothetical protein